jgi:hypothetical protein
MRHLAAAVAAAMLLCLAGLTRAADDPTGTWKWETEVNGQKRETTLKLKLDGGKLTGTVLGRNNQETAIEEATFKDGSVTFKVTRDRNGVKTTRKYTGKLDGDTIKGKIEFERDNQPQTMDWEAKRSK